MMAFPGFLQLKSHQVCAGVQVTVPPRGPTVVRAWAITLGAALCCYALQDVLPAHAQSTPVLETSREGADQLASTAAAAAPLCRFGVNMAAPQGGVITDFDTAALRIGWYIDYQAATNAARPNGVEYAPVIHLQQVGTNGYSYSPAGTALTAAIAANPGADWLIGNEPDRRDFQDDLLPALYARAYHELYGLIKAADPTAHLFAGTIVQPTPLRLQYLDLVLATYRAEFGERLPADGWAIHNFILNEASCEFYKDIQVCWGADIPPGITATDGLRITLNDNDRFDLFVEQIERFRHWMSAHGYGGKPLYLSEYGVLMPERLGYNASRVNAFMNSTFDYLLQTSDPRYGDPMDDNRLVQRLSWYSTADNAGFNGYLFTKANANAPYTLSPMGSNYVSYTSQLSPTVDLYTANLIINPPAPLTSTGNVTFTIRAVIANSGDGLATHTAVVRFHRGDPANSGQQIGADQTVTLGGCGESAVVQVTLPNVAPGSYPIYVTVDPGNQVAERNEQNNRTQSNITFANSRLFLPLLGLETLLP